MKQILKPVKLEIHANYYGYPYSLSTEYPLEEKLSKVHRLSKVSIRNVQDVYNALTDRETLNKVLEQGINQIFLTFQKLFLLIN
jgi:hypothetical protein